MLLNLACTLYLLRECHTISFSIHATAHSSTIINIYLYHLLVIDACSHHFYNKNNKGELCIYSRTSYIQLDKTYYKHIYININTIQYACTFNIIYYYMVSQPRWFEIKCLKVDSSYWTHCFQPNNYWGEITRIQYVLYKAQPTHG